MRSPILKAAVDAAGDDIEKRGLMPKGGSSRMARRVDQLRTKQNDTGKGSGRLRRLDGYLAGRTHLGIRGTYQNAKGQFSGHMRRAGVYKSLDALMAAAKRKKGKGKAHNEKAERGEKARC